MSATRPIVIFDTTLRDGEQSPGCSMNLAEKLEIAQALVDLGVDIIEAGFPDRLARRLRGRPRDRPPRSRRRSSAAWPAATTPTSTAPGRPSSSAAQPRIHVFLATSAIHREFKLKMTREEIIAPGRRRREAGRRLLRRRRVLARGRRPHRARFPLPGRRGGHRRRRDDGQHPRHRRLRHAGPHGAASSARSRERVPNIDKAVISVHCHNDLGLAVANSLAAVENGAGQIECTINGIGERAGNCSLEEVVMALRTRHDYYHCRHAHQHAAARAHQPAGVQHHRHAGAAEQGDRRPQRLRPRGGHPPGRHAQGARAPTRSCGPRTSAFTQTDLVLGKHSGRAALADRAKALGYHLDAASSCRRCSSEFKKLADKKKEIYDGDIVALIEQQMRRACPEVWSSCPTMCERGTGPHAHRHADAAPRRRGGHRGR